LTASRWIERQAVGVVHQPADQRALAVVNGSGVARRALPVHPISRRFARPKDDFPSSLAEDDFPSLRSPHQK